jgi:hypothetical protein
MLWNPKVLWDTLRGVVHVNWVVMGMNNTPLIIWTKIIKPMVFANYPKHGIAYFLGFGMNMQYPSMIFWLRYGAKGYIIYPNRGISCALNNYGHKQYPSNNLDQNNSIHGVYKIPSQGNYFPSRFEFLIFGLTRGGWDTMGFLIPCWCNFCIMGMLLCEYP